MTGKKAVTASPRLRPKGSHGSTRERVLAAAFAVFRKRGFSAASTLEIATRAQVSKRDLYALFRSKHAMLTACISERASRMRQPLELAAPIPSGREAVAATLVELGTSVLRVASHPDVLAVHRLAIAESDRAPGREAYALSAGAFPSASFESAGRGGGRERISRAPAECLHNASRMRNAAGSAPPPAITSPPSSNPRRSGRHVFRS